MKKFSLILLILAALISVFCLAEVANKPVEVDFHDLSSQMDSLNQEFQGTVLEGPVGKIFGDERINIYVQLENGQEQAISLITEDKKVKSLSLGENEGPTLTVQVNEAVIKDILSAKNPELALKKAVKDKKINYQARGFFRKIKLAVISLFVNFKVEEETKIEMPVGEAPKTEAAEEKEKTPEEKKEEKQEEKVEAKENKTETKTEIKAEPAGPKTYTVEINAAGFNPKELKIKANDLVEWKNLRNGYTLKTAMVLGTQGCSAIKSSILKTNEKFSWTFTKPMKCTIVDGISTTQIGKIVVE